jgi:hypothetical protein
MKIAPIGGNDLVNRQRGKQKSRHGTFRNGI